MLTCRSGPMVRPLRYRGAGIAPITMSGSPEPPLALPPAKIVPVVLGPKWNGSEGSASPAGEAAVPVPHGARRPARGAGWFPRAPAGWDRPLAEVTEIPFHLPGSGTAAERGAACPGSQELGR